MIIFVTKHVQVINNYSISNPVAKGRNLCQSSQFIGQSSISVAVKTPSCFLTNFKFEPRITLTKTVYLMGTIYDHIMKASIVQRLFMKFYHSCFDVFFFICNCRSLVVYMHNLFPIFLDHDMLSDIVGDFMLSYSCRLVMCVVVVAFSLFLRSYQLI